MENQRVSATLEDYLKSIWILSQGREEGLVPLGVLAKSLHLSPGTVTTMVKRFSLEGWLIYYPRRGCQLTPKGQKRGILLHKKHRLIEYFLAECLQMDKDSVHREAEILEHSISDTVTQKLDHFLGYPSHDPHGKEILR